jgi:hypothetical protein
VTSSCISLSALAGPAAGPIGRAVIYKKMRQSRTEKNHKGIARLTIRKDLKEFTSLFIKTVGFFTFVMLLRKLHTCKRRREQGELLPKPSSFFLIMTEKLFMLKGQCYEIFDFWFFSKSVSLKPLIIPLGPFQIFSKIRGDICSTRCKWKKSSIIKVLII